MIPIIRWVIGPVSEDGFECLKLSVFHFRKLYKDSFRYVVCYNGLSNSQKKLLPDVELLDQSNFMKSLPVFPCGPAWKLYPPRISVETHEIIIDNDIVIYKKPEAIAEFLKEKDMFVVTESLKRSYSGIYQKDIPENFNINSGFVCLPPNFDYRKELLKNKLKKWENHFDEQTLVAKVLSVQKKIKIINLSEIYVCFDRYKEGSCGVHLVGLNNKINSLDLKVLQRSIGLKHL
jgi:hypothetical protein